MGRKDQKPNPLELARGGDEDALEKVLGGVVAPVFDLALHRYRQLTRAEQATVEGLRALAVAVRGGGPDGSLMAEAVLAVLASGDEAERRPGGKQLDVALMPLDADQRRAVLAAIACDLDEDELAYALQVDRQTALKLYAFGLEAIALDRESLRESMDARAAETPLPPGLIDRALA